MNGKNFSSLEQKGLQQDGKSVRPFPFYAEGKSTKQDVRYSPVVRPIHTLSQYFELLKELHDKNEKRLKEQHKELGSLFLYRGQGNVNFDYSPTILRTVDNIKREHILQKEFHRRFFNVMDGMKTLFDEEVLMQHYGAGSRCLDLLENPLMALWAACETESEAKFKDTFGEVSFWCLDYADDADGRQPESTCVLAEQRDVLSGYCLLLLGRYRGFSVTILCAVVAKARMIAAFDDALEPPFGQ